MGPGSGLKTLSETRLGFPVVKEAQSFSWLSVPGAIGSIMESVTRHMFSMSRDCYLELRASQWK